MGYEITIDTDKCADKAESAKPFPVEIYRIDEDGKAVLTECASCVSDGGECESCAIFKDYMNEVDRG